MPDHDGNTQKSNAMRWDDLPYDLEEQIFSHLSLVELADVSSTRKTFLEAYRKQLAEQQKALCDQAVVRFGHEWIMSLAEICNRFHKEGIADKDLAKGIGQLNLLPLDDTILNVYLERSWPSLRMEVWQRGGMWVRPPTCQQDFGWMSLLQLLLTWGVPPFRDDQCVYLDIRDGAYLSTSAWVKAEILLLLPLVAECKILCWGERLGKTIIIKERKLVEENVSDANRGVTLIVHVLFWDDKPSATP